MSPAGKPPSRPPASRARAGGRRPVLLAVADTAAAYAGLLRALAELGGRAGWLELGAPAAPPAGLEEAAAAGVLRAVAVGGQRVTTVKPIRGAAVLDDLLREHFRGCRLVLVRGGEGLVRLTADGGGWRLESPAGRSVQRSTAELLASLSRPSFWRRLERPAAAAGDPPAGD